MPLLCTHTHTHTNAQWKKNQVDMLTTWAKLKIQNKIPNRWSHNVLHLSHFLSWGFGGHVEHSSIDEPHAPPFPSLAFGFCAHTLWHMCVHVPSGQPLYLICQDTKHTTAVQNAGIAFSPFLWKGEYPRLPGVGPKQMIAYHCTQPLGDKDWTKFLGNLD